jgi:ribosomal protein S27E
MNVQCLNCGHVNNIPPNMGNVQFRCYYCGAFLPKATVPSSNTSEAVGLIGGAALGAAIGGPVGALIGGIIGAIIGREAKANG